MNTLVSYDGNRRFGTLLSWDPWRLVNDLMSSEPVRGRTVWSAFPAPVRIEQLGDGATISADMPGVDPADVDLTFEAGTLAITGKRGDHTYRYSIALGDTFDADNIEAELDRGVLTVRARVRPEARPRKIAIRAGQPAQAALGTGERA